MVLFGVAAGAAVTPGQPFVYQIVHDDSVLDASGGGGFAYGLMNSCYSIGLIIGPVVGGALNRYYGFLCSLLIYSGVLFISVIIFYSKVVHYSDKK